MPGLKYVHDWKTIKEHTVLNKHQQDENLGNVQDAIEQVMGTKVYDKFRALDENEKRTLHSSRGNKLLKEGNHVLEIDVAGSGFDSFRAAHKEFTGKNSIVRDGVKVSADDIRNQKFKKANFLNRWNWLQKLPKKLRPMTEREIDIHNAIIDEYSFKEAVQQVKETRKQNPENQTHKKAPKIKGAELKSRLRFDRIVEEKYGKALSEHGPGKHIRVKRTSMQSLNGATVDKTRYTMPGPLKMGGMRDAGDYSIDNLSSYMLSAGKNYLGNLFEHWMDLEGKARDAIREGNFQKAEEIRSQKTPVTISLKGHSRGAVAVSHGAMKIKYWIHENYPQFEKYVNFELTQYDPVPGYFSDKGTKHRINLRRYDTPEDEKELKKLGMMPLGDKAQTTVIYSMHTQYSRLFSPQNVKGAKRVIFVPTDHGVNLDEIDASQGKKHRKGYTDISDGQVYRGSGINELPEGVYMADEKHRLVRMTNAKDAQTILHEITKKNSSQDSRHRRLDKAIDNWFAEAQEREHSRSQKKERISLESLQAPVEGRKRSNTVASPAPKKEKEEQRQKMRNSL